MKKLISVMLVLCMVLALVPAMAFAAGNTVAMVGEQPFDDIQKAVDAAVAGTYGTNRVDVVADLPTCTIQVSGKIVMQLNGHTLTATSTTYGYLPVNIVGAAAELTIQGPGTIKAAGSSLEPVIGNGGKVTIEQGATIYGVIVNTGSVNITSATVIGTFDNKGTVTVSGGTFYENAAYPFFNGGTVQISGGYFDGTLHKHGTDAASITITGGAFTDADFAKHVASGTPYGSYDQGGAALQGTPVPSQYNVTAAKVYLVGEAAMNTYAWWFAEKYNGPHYVHFMKGDMNLPKMPNYTDYNFWYIDDWNSYYTSNSKPTVDGRGLVNGNSNFNVLVARATQSPTSDPVAGSVLDQNISFVTGVESVFKSVNKNEVFIDINIYADMSQLISFKAPTTWNKLGNYGDNHAWYPLLVGFTGLNGSVEPTLTHRTWFNQVLTSGTMAAYDKASNWNSKTSDSIYEILWVGLDHTKIPGSDNDSFDLYDDRTDITYRLTINVIDKDAPTPAPSEPDDESHATTHPGSAATTKPAGTGEGDGPAKTGDNSTVMLWATLLVASAAGVAICVVDEAKKRSRK